MRRTAFLLGPVFGLGGALLLAAAPAQAEEEACNAQIMALQQYLTATPGYAGTVPMAPGDSAIASGTNADPGPAPLPPPAAEVPAPGATLGAPPSADPGGGGDIAHAAPSGSGEAGSTPGNDPLPLPAARGGVLSGTPAPAQTEPMDEDKTQAGQVLPESSNNPDEAAKALARARAFDQVGDEAACLDAVAEARSELGLQ